MTKRGARSLVCGGHKYLMNRRGRDDKIYWRCAKSRSCGETVITQEGTVILVEDYSHPPDPAEIKAQKVISSLKKKVVETIQRVPLMYQSKLQHVSSREDTIYWRCAMSWSCGGTVTTQEGTVISVKDHGHPPNPAEIKAQKVISSLKKKVLETIQSVPLMYQSELQHLSMAAKKTGKKLHQGYHHSHC